MNHAFVDWYYGVYTHGTYLTTGYKKQRAPKKKWEARCDGDPVRCAVCSWVKSHPYHQ